MGTVHNALIASLAVSLAAAAGAQSSDSAAIRERPATGAYTEEQASRGAAAYEAYCVSCHETSFHTDAQFRANWFGRSLLDLFRTIRTTMPEDNPGGLSDDDYTRIIAYVLKLNGFAPGADSLSSDTLKLRSIRFRPAADSTLRDGPDSTMLQGSRVVPGRSSRQ